MEGAGKPGLMQGRGHRALRAWQPSFRWNPGQARKHQETSKEAGSKEKPQSRGPCPHLAVMEGLGADGQAAQLDGLLEPGGNLQSLQLVIGMPGQFVGAQGLALLG